MYIPVVVCFVNKRGFTHHQVSIFAPVHIPEDERVLCEQFFFESHHHCQLQTYYSKESLLMQAGMN